LPYRVIFDVSDRIPDIWLGAAALVILILVLSREWAAVLSFESIRTGDPESVVLLYTKTADAAQSIVDALRARGVETDVG
jgi:hypothetical protein